MKICSSEKEFIAAVAPYAQRACKRFEVELGQPFYLPSVLVAQACKEVGYAIPSYWDNPGVRGLVEESNMVGIKRSLLNGSWTDIGLGCWDGKYLSKKTPEVYDGKPVIITDDFRIYRDPEQSFMDYLCFMRWGGYSVGNPKYYPKIKDLHDYRSLIKQVHALGYATGPTYSGGVCSIIEKHGLTAYDDLKNVTPSAYWPSGAGGSADMVDNIIINKNPMGVRTHNTSKRSDSIKYICIHYVGALGDAKANIDYYNQPSTTEASADFYVGHDGTIWQYNVDPVTRYCWAVGGGRQSSYGGSLYGICKNANSISIEMCVKSKTGKAPKSPNDPNWYLTDLTYQGAVKLTKYLMKVYSIPADRVIRHFDVNGKLCPGVVGWNSASGSEAEWNRFKNDIIGASPAPTPTPTPTGKVWKVQLGAYQRRGNALNKLKMAQEKIAKDAFITDLQDGYYRVQVGSFSVYQNAVNLRDSIINRKLSDAIIKEYNA